MAPNEHTGNAAQIKLLAGLVVLCVLAGGGLWFNMNRQSAPADAARSNELADRAATIKHLPANFFRRDVLKVADMIVVQYVSKSARLDIKLIKKLQSTKETAEQVKKSYGAPGVIIATGSRKVAGEDFVFDLRQLPTSDSFQLVGGIVTRKTHLPIIVSGTTYSPDGYNLDQTNQLLDSISGFD